MLARVEGEGGARIVMVDLAAVGGLVTVGLVTAGAPCLYCMALSCFLASIHLLIVVWSLQSLA